MSHSLVFMSILGKDQQSFAVAMILYWGMHLIVIGTAQYDRESSLSDMKRSVEEETAVKCRVGSMERYHLG